MAWRFDTHKNCKIVNINLWWFVTEKTNVEVFDSVLWSLYFEYLTYFINIIQNLLINIIQLFDTILRATSYIKGTPVNKTEILPVPREYILI